MEIKETHAEYEKDDCIKYSEKRKKEIKSKTHLPNKGVRKFSLQIAFKSVIFLVFFFILFVLFSFVRKKNRRSGRSLRQVRFFLFCSTLVWTLVLREERRDGGRKGGKERGK